MMTGPTGESPAAEHTEAGAGAASQLDAPRVPADGVGSEEVRPLSAPRVLGRGAPFALATVLAFATVTLFGPAPRLGALLAATAVTLALAGAALFVPWRRLPAWTEAIPPLSFFPVIALMRDAVGGGPTGYAPLLFLPILWLALYGSRRQLVVGLALGALTLVVPVVLVGAPQYPDTELRRAVLFVAIASLMGFVVQRLVQDVREGERLAERQARTEAEREAYLRTVMDSAAEGVMAVNPAGLLSFVNPAAAALCGRSVAEMLGRPAYELLHHHGTDDEPIPRERWPVLEALRSGAESGIEREAFARKNGSSFPVEYRAMPLVVEGEVVGAVCTFSDVSQRLEVERIKSEFVSVVSHELRTPLTSIRGSLGLMQGGVLGEMSDEAQEMLAIAISNADRLVRLINDILDAERLESGKAPIKMKQVELAQVMRQIQELLVPAAGEAGVALRVEPLAASLYADPDRVIQTLVNLVGNAIKFSSEGTTVTVSGERLGDRVRIAVRDQGPGIPADQRASIFDRFAQVESGATRSKGGSGLGLAIARGIVEQHGGRIWVESPPEGGSVFLFELPAFSSAAGRTHVLIVENELDLAQVLAARIKRAGIRVRQAGSLAEVKATLRDGVPDLVILDLALPDADPAAIASWLDAGDPLAGSKVLIYTALDVSGEELLALRRHAEVMTKGRVGVEELEQRVLESLGSRTVPPA
jgi:PAS domain S-box-containing protein